MRKYPLSLLTSILTSQWQRLVHLHRKPEVLCRCPRAVLLRVMDPFVLCGYVRGLVPGGPSILEIQMRSRRKTHRLPTIRGPAETLRRQCRQALPSSRRACLHLSLRLATAFCPQAKTLPLSSSLNSVRAPAHTCAIAGLSAGVLSEASRRGIVGLDVVSHRNISPGPLIPTGRYG
jgi:hypothetical protein